MSFNKIIDKYLSKQNLSNWEIVQKDENEKFSNVIVIPAICEFENIRKLIESLLSNNLQNINKTLALFIINNKVNDSNEIKNDNLNSIKYIEKLLNSDTHKLKFGYIDCFLDGKELPEKDAGAGLARKIGMDLALNLFDFSNKEKKVLISLDSDCLVSENYIKEDFDFLNKKNIPVVFINPRFRNINFNSIVVDYSNGAYQIITKAINDGVNNLACFCNGLSNSNENEKFNGFINAIVDKKKSINLEWINYGDFSYEKIFNILVEFKKLNKLPEIIFITNEEYTIWIISILEKLNLKIGEDIDLIY